MEECPQMSLYCWHGHKVVDYLGGQNYKHPLKLNAYRPFNQISATPKNLFYGNPSKCEQR